MTLHIDQFAGSLEACKKADFVVLDYGGPRINQIRFERARTVEELLFAHIILGNGSNARKTWSMGNRL